MRNADRQGKGLGFALAGNFYPDFLLWLVDDASGKQWLTFVDPKGLRNLDLSHPKLGLYKEVKTLEATLAAEAKAGEPPLVLNLKTVVGHVRMGRHGDVLGRRDNAAGYCPQGGATPPARPRMAQSGV